MAVRSGGKPPGENTIADFIAFAISLAAVVGFFWLVFSLGKAAAHSWYDAACCSDRDCAPVPDEAVIEHPGGFEIRATGELVSRHNAKFGRDDRYHICRSPVSNALLCLYIPNKGS